MLPAHTPPGAGRGGQTPQATPLAPPTDPPLSSPQLKRQQYLETVMLREVSQRGETLYDTPYMRNLKRHDTKELIYEQKETHRLGEGTYGCLGPWWGE